MRREKNYPVGHSGPPGTSSPTLIYPTLARLPTVSRQSFVSHSGSPDTSHTLIFSIRPLRPWFLVGHSGPPVTRPGVAAYSLRSASRPLFCWSFRPTQQWSLVVFTMASSSTSWPQDPETWMNISPTCQMIHDQLLQFPPREPGYYEFPSCMIDKAELQIQHEHDHPKIDKLMSALPHFDVAPRHDNISALPWRVLWPVHPVIDTFGHTRYKLPADSPFLYPDDLNTAIGDTLPNTLDDLRDYTISGLVMRTLPFLLQILECMSPSKPSSMKHMKSSSADDALCTNPHGKTVRKSIQLLLRPLPCLPPPPAHLRPPCKMVAFRPVRHVKLLRAKGALVHLLRKRPPLR